MKPLLSCFKQFIRQILRDGMLIAVLFAPFLMGGFFKFAVPALENLLCGYFQKSSILSDYYLLFDLLLCLIAPYMVCFASAMVMLTEHDENAARYLAVTPVGKSGYILSRLVFPAVIASVLSVPLVLVFSLTEWNVLVLLVLSLLSGVHSVLIAMFVFVLSHNKVEGMAVAKFSSLLLAGLFVPFFLPQSAQYLFSLLPSFWIARWTTEQNPLQLFAAILSLSLWLWVCFRRFLKKIS